MVIALAALLVLSAWLAASLWARSRVLGAIAQATGGELRTPWICYVPPLGVHLRGAVLLLPSPSGPVEVVRIRSATLKLAKLPRRGEPAVIESLVVSAPSLQLVRTQQGLILNGRKPAGNVEPRQSGGQHSSPHPAAKFSDRLQLTSLRVTGASIRYEDRTRPNAPAVEWQNFDVDVRRAGSDPGAGAGDYSYELNGHSGGIADLHASGTLYADAMLVQVSQLAIGVRVDPSALPEALPAQLQSLLHRYQIGGRLKLDGQGQIVLQDFPASTYDASIELDEASAYVPAWDSTLDRLALKLRCQGRPIDDAAGGTAAAESGNVALAEAGPATAPAARGKRALPAVIRLEKFEAGSGDSSLRVDKGTATIDWSARRWKLADLAGELEMGRTLSPLPKRPRPALAKVGAKGQLVFTAATGEVGLPFHKPDLIDLEFLLYPRGVGFQPPTFPAAISDLGSGSVRKARGSRVIVLENLTASYGGDLLALAAARLPLPQDVRELARDVRFEEINGTVTFQRPGPDYPPPLRKIIASLRPVGAFTLGGGYYDVKRIEHRPGEEADPLPAPLRKTTWFFQLGADDATFLLGPREVPVTHIKGDSTISNLLVDIRRVEGKTLGGTLVGRGRITPGHPFLYNDCRGYLGDVELNEIGNYVRLPEDKKSRLSGRGFVRADFEGQGPSPAHSAADMLRARGEFEVFDGNFFTIPLLHSIATDVKRGGKGERGAGGAASVQPAGHARALSSGATQPASSPNGESNATWEKMEEALTVGEAAGVFEIAAGKMVLRQAAISAPALGLQGSGTINFDKTLDLKVVAAPLGDLRDKMRQTGVPIVSDVAGEIAGAIQRVLTAATSTLLYEYRITGPIENPRSQAIPVPVLTGPAALIFGQMLDPPKDQHLIDAVRSGEHKPER